MNKAIDEGNFLIAKFVGFRYPDMDNEIWKLSAPDIHNYHKDWRQLMPVVEKIEHEITPVEVLDTQCRIGRTIYGEEILISSDNSKIEAVWQAVVQFIQGYNNQKQQGHD